MRASWCQPEDPKRYARYLALVTPPVSAQRGYDRSLADLFQALGARRLPVRTTPNANTIVLTPLASRRSVFFRRSYWIAWLDPEVFCNHYGSHSEAVLEPPPLGAFVPRPPLVYAPATSRADRSRAFTLVLEHEFIHLNQCLRSPASFHVKRTPTGPGLLGELFSSTTNEFLANYLECSHHYRDQSSTAFQMRLSLLEWSLLRGYTQPLEHLFEDIVIGTRTVTSTALLHALRHYPLTAPSGLSALDLPPSLITWLRSRWAWDVAAALALAIERVPPQIRPPLSNSLLDVAAWTRPIILSTPPP